MIRSRPIRLRGVRVHNLKGIDLDLPRGAFIAITGVSGSGKSSLAFDTLYAEGQRRYVETFSAYTRQFLETLEKPDADLIEGIPPAIAVSQRAGGDRRSIRSTVGTVTEIHDHLALLFAKVGRTFCVNCGREVEPADASAVARAIEALPNRSKYLIAFPLDLLPGSDRQALADILREDGFTRIRAGGQVVSIETGPLPTAREGETTIDVVVDRLVRGTESTERRLDSIETAFSRGMGRCRVITDDHVEQFNQAWRCGHCGKDAIPPEPRLFRFNSPLGACPECEGVGRITTLDLDRVVPDPTKTLCEGAILPWTFPSYSNWSAKLLKVAAKLAIPVDRPFQELSPEQVAMIVDGVSAEGFEGLKGFVAALERKAYRLPIRVFLSRWRGHRVCPSCQGARLRPEALAVRLNGLNIAEVSTLKIREARAFLDRVVQADEANPIIRGVHRQTAARLHYLEQIGLDALTLDRPARTLSGGEAQRLALTSALGSGLVNMLYVLDEPSIGLHASDTGRLVAILKALRDRGNTVVIVEHDLGIVREADLMVDIGPGAGEAGGNLLYVGPPGLLADSAGSSTASFLNGENGPKLPDRRTSPTRGFLKLVRASGHNLKGIDVDFPLGLLCVVTGVSGSGKTTLIEETLYPALAKTLGQEAVPAEPYRSLKGTESLQNVILIDQSPIGRSGRSNPVTYLKAFDEIRKTFAETHEAKVRNYGAGRFSFNVEGGRCNTCEGNGFITVDMQFLPDVLIRCSECKGTRYRPETLEIAYRGKNIAEVLDMTVRESFGFFRHRPKILARLRPLMDVGLDYLRLGQPASTLSGGEAQRLKLANHLATTPGAITRAANKASTLFLFDEPTTGLHPADVLKLLDALTSLLTLGHSLIIIEHSPEVIVRADWIIDLGPGSGDEGGSVVGQGTPEDVAKLDTPTGRLLDGLLNRGTKAKV